MVNQTKRFGLFIIVLKLLSKKPEDRYQSVRGLISDLENCRQQLVDYGLIESFQLGSKDVSKEFTISQKIYGRDKEAVCEFENVAYGEKLTLLTKAFPFERYGF